MSAPTIEPRPDRNFRGSRAPAGGCNEHGLEGIVSKRIDRPYISGRTKNWIKIKCPGWKEANRQRFKMFEER